MIEGWQNDVYLILFEGEDEIGRMTKLYGVQQFLPGFTVVGLRGWDDFIVADAQGRLFLVPTTPPDPNYLEPLPFRIDAASIKPDERFTKKVKWYITPLRFGGDPGAKDNTAWITIEQHAELVRWWSKLHLDITAKKATGYELP